MPEAAVAAPVATPTGRTCCSPARRRFRRGRPMRPSSPTACARRVRHTVGIMAVTEGLFIRPSCRSPAGSAGQDDRIVRCEHRRPDVRRDRAGRGAGGPPSISLVFIIPIAAAITAAIILGIWGMLMGGVGTFKQVYAIMAHSKSSPRCRSSSRCPSAMRPAGWPAPPERVRADARRNVVSSRCSRTPSTCSDLVVRQRGHRYRRVVQAENHRPPSSWALRMHCPGARRRAVGN